MVERNTALSEYDVLALNLLESARAKRARDIAMAAERARKPDDLVEHDASLSGILASESIRLHERMMQLNRRYNLPRFIGGTISRIERGPEYRGNNNYGISTPLLLKTDQELIVDSAVEDGYIFTSDHIRTPRYMCGGGPTLMIRHVVVDTNYGTTSEYPYPEYVIRVNGRDSGHPFVLQNIDSSGGLDPEVESRIEGHMLQKIGLVRFAVESLT